METLEHQYELSKTVRGDIEEHIETLYEYTKRGTSVLELGVRACVSTWAFLKGLMENGADKKRLVCNDITYHGNIEQVKTVAKEVGVDMEFIQKNDLLLDFGTETFDITFIDTWHVYGQLKRELRKFAPMTNKYIIMHDTEIDREHGESVRSGWNTARQARETNIPEVEIRKGLQPAIDEFLAEHPEWVVELVKTNNNGLTILARH